MSAPTTLADLVLRETFSPKSTLHSGELRRTLTAARRFVLDESMSAFMVDISQVPFQTAPVRRPGVLDSLRHGARLPHPKTWVEFDGRAFRAELLRVIGEGKVRDVFGASLGDPSVVVPRWGWLMEEHSQVPQAVTMRQFADLGGHVVEMPFKFVWQTTDEPLPWAADTQAGELAHGLQGYDSPHMGIVYPGPIPKGRQLDIVHSDGEIRYTTDKILAETAGTTRYAVALLATLNDVPATMTEVHTDRGFVARGSYHKFLDHTTVRLTVPQNVDVRRLARKLVAVARQRAHPVRGHWRLYQRGEGALCPNHDHTWGPATPDPVSETERAPCLKCSAWRTWIKEHQRGDASLGFVTHDYAVTHNVDGTTA